PSFDAYQKEIIKSLETLVNLLKTEDKILVAQFGQKLKIKTPLTDDRKKIIDAIEDKNIEEGTSIYDTIKTLEDEHLQKNSGQNLVIFISDGVDTTSTKETYESALKIAEKSNAGFFVIKIDTFQEFGKNGKNRRSSIPNNTILGDILGQIINGGGYGATEEEYKIGEQFMTELVASTGGRMVEVDRNLNDLKKAIQIIGVTIRLQQFIGYKSKSSENNKRKELKVRVNRPNLIVRIRDNYY
ncbi:MAG: VWA domain-containing protein, partial [Aridibacter sp.]